MTLPKCSCLRLYPLNKGTPEIPHGKRPTSDGIILVQMLLIEVTPNDRQGPKGSYHKRWKCN
jgi:hypothetical protein